MSWSIVIPSLILLLGGYCFWSAFRITAPRAGRSGVPVSAVRLEREQHEPSELIKAHLMLRDVGYRYRDDLRMFALFKLEAADQPIHPDDGYIVFVTHYATLCGWLNACEALEHHRLRRDAEGNIMSPHNIDPATGQ